MNLLFEPVTISCGHTLCNQCLQELLKNSNDCPVCRDKISHPREVKVNFLLKELIESKYPEVVKARIDEMKTEELKQHQEEVKNVRGVKSPCVYIKSLHVLPKQHRIQSFPVIDFDSILTARMVSNRICLLTKPYTENNNIGCIVDVVPIQGPLSHALLLIGLHRFRVHHITEEYVEALNKYIMVCEGEAIVDHLPEEESQRQEQIELSKQVYQRFKTALEMAPPKVKESVKNKYQSDPFISESASPEAHILFASSISLYMADILGAEQRSPDLLNSTNTMERLRWCEALLTKENSNPFLKDDLNPIFQFLSFFLLGLIVLFVARIFYNSH